MAGFTQHDLIDALMRHLGAASACPAAVRGAGGGKASAPAAPVPRPLSGRRFLTEHEIKKALTPGARHLTIPEDAIVSPLALDWLALKGVDLVRSSS